MLRPGDHRIDVLIDGVMLQFKARIVPDATHVLFNFHGAIDRATSQLPVFNSFFPELANTHQIAISDPSLTVATTFRLSWYAGHAGFDAQMRIPTALKAITNALGAKRATYFGNSGGGFAALYCSHCAPGSIALVGNPQTSILRYAKHLVALYREACWPDLAANEDLAGAICSDLPALYAQGFGNTIIYCQSMGDRVQTTAHMVPFVGAIAGQPRAGHLLLYSDFKGIHGHVSDREAYQDWANAIAASPTEQPKDLLDAWHAVRRWREQDQSPHKETPAMPAPGSRFDEHDIATADKLRAYRQDGS